MFPQASIAEWIIGIILIFSSAGVILLSKPIYACLSFLLSLMGFAALYLKLSAEFIALMQILVYAGAILVIFVFVIVLFQDAHAQLEVFKPKTGPFLILFAGISFAAALAFFGNRLIGHFPLSKTQLSDFGTVQGIGRALYLDFFFPFEAVILLFLIAIIGALYIAKKES